MNIKTGTALSWAIEYACDVWADKVGQDKVRDFAIDCLWQHYHEEATDDELFQFIAHYLGIDKAREVIK